MSKEWDQVQELYEMIDEIESFEAQDFITELFDLLDPDLPFLEQKSGQALKWLNSLYEQYVNGDEDAAKEIWDD